MAGDDGLLESSEVSAIVGAAEGPTSSPRDPNDPQPVGSSPIDAQPYRLDEIAASETSTTSTSASDVSLILDVDLNVRVELGRTRMYIEDVLKLHEGSIVPLEKLAGDPVDIYVNGRLMGRGEVLVLNDNFCVRLSEIVGEQTEAASQEAAM